MTTIGYLSRWNNYTHLNPKSPWIYNEMNKWKELGYKIEPFGWLENNGNGDFDYDRIKKVDFFIVHFADSIKYMHRIPKPFIVICHSEDLWQTNGEELKHFSQSKFCKGIGYISNYHLNYMKERGINHNFIFTPVNADYDMFKRTKPLGDKIVSWGRLCPTKGFEHAIKAVPNITIAGGVFKQDYADYLKTLSNKTTFTGYLPNDKLVELLNDSWLYIFTGVILPDGNADGMPTTIKDALLMEMQVLASPIHGTVDYKDYVTFIDPKDTKGIRQAIKDTPKVRNTAGREWVIKNHSIEKFIENVRPIVDKL